MSIAISYSCSEGTATGSGFSTPGSSGSATAIIAAPPAGTHTATYGLTCTNKGATSVAQCNIEVGRPSIILVANPKTVESGKTSLIGWVTSGMQSCTVSSPDQSDFTARNASNASPSGTAETSAITKTSAFLLHCQTLAGGVKDATTTVTLAGSAASAISVNASVHAGEIDHGDDITITWQSQGQDSDARVALWLVNAPDHNTPVALIAGGLGVVGSYVWHVPSATSTCLAGTFKVCASDLVAGESYAIEADVYTPHDAYVGEGDAPSNPISPVYGDYADTADFTVGN